MSELLFCPFCGGEAEMLTAESMHGGYMFGIMCNDCRSRGDVYDTEAEAVEAWNTRHERTCKQERIFNLIERGCDGKYYSWRGDEMPTYCPNCGAKVVGE